MIRDCVSFSSFTVLHSVLAVGLLLDRPFVGQYSGNATSLLLLTCCTGGVRLAGSGEHASSRSLLALLGSNTFTPILFVFWSVFVKAVDEDWIVLFPEIGTTEGGETPLSFAALPRLTLPRRIFRVLAWAESSGYIVSSICIEFSCDAEGDEEFIADEGSLPGTGSACLGVADPNCNGEEGTLCDGEGVVVESDVFTSS